MEISFRTKKLQKACNSAKAMNAEWGDKMAKKLQQRLSELQAADTLHDVSRLPPARCHELSNNLAGYLSVDLVHPYRLLFLPNHDPVPTKDDGGLDWSAVTAVCITGVEDTH